MDSVRYNNDYSREDAKDNITIALDIGDQKSVENIMANRMRNTSVSLPRIVFDKNRCKTEIFFLDSNLRVSNKICFLKKEAINSNPFYVLSIEIKMIDDNTYILSEDEDVLKTSSKIIAIPIYDSIYSLINKESYDKNSTEILYSLYKNIYMKLNSRSVNISYENFKNKSDIGKLAMTRDLISNKINQVRNNKSWDDFMADQEI